MNKKTIVAFLIIAAVLLGGIAAAVCVLYADQTPKADDSMELSGNVSEGVDVLKAVPSDAAAVFTFDDLLTAVGTFSDPGFSWNGLIASSGRTSLDKFISDLAERGIPSGFESSQTAVSVQYSGALSPLLIVDCRSMPDSSAAVVDLVSRAQVLGLKSKAARMADGTLILVSPSDADVVSSCKHITAKASILDHKSFSRMLSRQGRNNLLFISNEALPRILPELVAKPYSRVASFLSSVSEWTVLSLPKAGDRTAHMSASSAQSRGAAYFENVLADLPSATCDLPAVLPKSTFFAVDLCVQDVKAYVDAYRKYLDAHHDLTNTSAELQWAVGEGISEVASASWTDEAGKVLQALLIRVSKSVKEASVPAPNEKPGYVSALFGKAFDIPDEGVAARKGDWLFMGSAASVSSLLASEETLLEHLGELSLDSMFPAKVCGPLVYFSFTAAPDASAGIFRGAYGAALQKSLSGFSSAPAVLSLQKGGWSLDVARSSTVLPSASGPVSIEIPSGPFPVKNCATGRTNLFYQNENLYLCLKEQDGKGLWGVSFDKPICGSVGEVDYFANGKIQFAFCAESSLYLIDRLGRFVGGFPVALGKPVLLGPAVFDFGGGKRYNIMVLHNDNTIEMYNLQGVRPASWKGITCPEAIVALPELKTVDGHRYWEVSTASKTYTYDFWGGESLKKK